MKKKTVHPRTGKVDAKSPPAKKSGQILVTKAMLDGTRSELMSEITSLRLEMKAGFRQVDVRMGQLDLRMDQLDLRMDQLDLRMDQLSMETQKVIAGIHRITVLVEEQNARNLYVLDGCSEPRLNRT
jgi:chaperonin cofactor prefoldin